MRRGGQEATAIGPPSYYDVRPCPGCGGQIRSPPAFSGERRHPHRIRREQSEGDSRPRNRQQHAEQLPQSSGGIFCPGRWQKGVQPLPAEPAQVAAYLAERLQEHGHKPATLRVAASAIAFAHKTANAGDPCASPEVKRTLRCATRKAGMDQKQAEALTAEALSAIESTACEPRLGRGGRYESQETARCRGNLDIALISLMRDAMLRVSEAAALTWRDIEYEADGTGRLLVRRSKTDAEGQGAVLFLSAPTMAALELIRNEAAARG